MATVASHMTKVSENLSAAKVLADAGLYRLSLSNSYYAAFHAVSACMITVDEDRSTHAQLLGEFNRLFLKTNKVNVPFKVVNALFKGRQQADYGDLLTYSREDAMAGYDAAVEVIEAVRVYLGV